MRFLDVYSEAPSDIVLHFLYKLLEDRVSNTSISHTAMPTWHEHCHFVRSRPYQTWRIIDETMDAVSDPPWMGAIYLTSRNEIGIHILSKFQGLGYGTWAVRELMHEFGDRRYLANINPLNAASQYFFEKLGFDDCQVTYQSRPFRKGDVY